MNKQHLYGLINPFERIAGLKALLWGLAGIVVSTALSYYSGWHYHGLLHLVRLESGVVVLCGGTPCRLADSGCYVLFGRIAAFPFTHTDGRCVGNGRFRTIAVDRHEPFQLLAAYAETRTDRCEHASGRDHATARIPCRDLVVACLFCL